MTPEQIETMRRIQRGEGIAVYSDVCLLPDWTWRAAPLSGAVTLTEAGAEVLRLWAEREAAAKEIPRHVRLTLATVQRAFERDDYRDLGTICEDVQSVADAAMMRVRAVKGERDALRDALNEAKHALTAERAAHAETLLVLAAEQGRLEGAPSDNMRINALCDLVDEVLNDTEAHGDPGRGTPVGSDGSTVGGLVQLARLGNPAGVAFIKSLLRGRVRVSFNRR